MTEFPRRYGSLSDWLYRFIADVARWNVPDRSKREKIEMALRFLKRLEVVHDEEEGRERWERRQQRQKRLERKKADVVKLVGDGNGKDAS
jgi:hypothetical protein